MVIFKNIRRWWLERTTKIVVMTTSNWGDGSVEEYAVRKRRFVTPFFFKYEYLDLSIIDDNAVNLNKNQGFSMYGDTSGVPNYKVNVSAKGKIHWWDKPETILKYCTSPDLNLVVNAQKALFYYIKPKPKKLPQATEIVDVNFELAQYKLRGGHKEKNI
jgi:hypothetical protein